MLHAFLCVSFSWEKLVLSTKLFIRIYFQRRFALGLASLSLQPFFYHRSIISCFFRPPEVLGRERYDKSCDMWSLGVAMYIL